VFGGQGKHVELRSHNVAFTESGSPGSGTGTFAFDVTVRNMLGVAAGTTPQKMNTPNGVVVDTGGVKVLFESLTVTSRVDDAQPASADVANEAGSRSFDGSETKPFFKYEGAELGADGVPGILKPSEISSLKNWRLALVNVNTFSFRLYVSTELENRVIINEVMMNPRIECRTGGEYFELYNAGNFPVDVQGFLIADSAQAGRRPYHQIAAPMMMAPGAFRVLGASPGFGDCGTPVNYSYGTALSLGDGGDLNQRDAIKLSWVRAPGDTITIDRVAYEDFKPSGRSKELRDPLSDNSDVDSWGDGLDSFGSPSQSGTPGSRNTMFGSTAQ